MSLATILVVVVLIAAGAVALALESGLLGRHAPAAVAGLVVLTGVAITVFMMNDADGKIEWGDKMEKIAQESGKKKERRAPAAAGGEGGAQQAAAADEGDATKGEGENGDGKPPEAEEKPPENDKEHEAFQDCEVCPIMVVVNKGSFKMGAPDLEHGARRFEGPVRMVDIPKNFAVSKMEITRAQYHAFIKETSFRTSSECIIGGVSHAGVNYLKPGIPQDEADPVVCIDWIDAGYYVAWLSEKTKSKYRLLSEAEWEYVARAGTKTPYATGEGVSRDEANFKNTWKQTQPTGSYQANAFGIKDMHGNVAEWVADCWHDTLKGAPMDNKPWLARGAGSDKCTSRVIRGGAWNSDTTEIRSAAREYETQSTARNTIGLRVAKRL